MIPLPPVHPVLMRWLEHGKEHIVPPLAQVPDDWAAMLADAKPHRLIPLLHRASRHGSKARVPDELAEELDRLAAATAAKNLLYQQVLADILRAAQQRGLACVPLRGVALGEQLYGDVALRPTGDIDLLVKREELAAVRALLDGLGYYEVEARPGFAAAFDYTLEFFKDHPVELIVEPHWTLAYPPFVERLSMAGVWRRCQRGTVAGVATSLLGPEDLLIHLGLHLLHHQHAAPVLWVYEIDRLIRVQPLDWSLVCAVTQDAGLAHLLHGVLEKVAATFRTPIPDGALAALSRRPSTGREVRLVDLLAQHPHVKGRERIALLVSLKGLRAKVRYAWSFLFPSPAFIRVQYGASSWWQVGWTYTTRLGYSLWGGLEGLARLLVPVRTTNESSGRPSS